MDGVREHGARNRAATEVRGPHAVRAPSAGVATLSVDGTALLTRTDFAANGVDATIRIRSVRKLCLRVARRDDGRPARGLAARHPPALA